ncbi:hypothetical protein J8L88_16750 [Aquimarina sp. MMG015]|uniref:hypothetical protein n=1 Tax=Aquimarina sp. MMG015 TaxID=2822689 RepID=UPI001B3A3FE6|nr:hypothetical protein [Aquimarina sp. MMG015]MBQ4804512.1 hypothetical protein [Aquimarina sp. MMG015]
MKKHILILTILFLNSSFIFSQEVITELNGFKLRQFKDAVKSEYKEPFQVKNFDDGFIAEIYLIKPDSTAYVIFEYPSWNKEIIFSIQIYGAFKDIDPRFQNLKMGISENELIEKIGKPSNSKDIGEYGKVLEYENTNYSFEINNNGKLASIKIVDNYNELFPDPKVEKIPSLEKIKEVLNSKNPKIISEILSPELEIYLDNTTLFFKQSWEDEINSDSSKMYKTISEIIKGIIEIDASDENQYEENIRLTHGENPKHVLKFKTGIKLKEIVMKWENGKYLIWEIKT